MAVSTVLVGSVLMSQMPILLAILVGVGVGALAGLVNGTIIVTTGVPAFIVTMGMMGIAKGVSLIIGAGKDMSIFPKSFTMIGTGLRWPGIILVVCVLFIFFILSRTRLGFNAFAIGGNSAVSRLSGVKVKRNQVIYYVIGGFLAGLAGVMYTAKFDLATPNTGDGWELQAIAAVVIGGTSLFGGKGGVFRTVVGVLIIKSPGDRADPHRAGFLLAAHHDRDRDHPGRHDRQPSEEERLTEKTRSGVTGFSKRHGKRGEGNGKNREDGAGSRPVRTVPFDVRIRARATGRTGRC